LESGGTSPQAVGILYLCHKRIREDAIPMVKLEATASQAIRLFLAEKGFQRPLRIDLQSGGCCDPSLCLNVDAIRESDLTQEVDGLTFVISPEIHELVGEVTISLADEIGRKGFVLTSRKPVSEWDGLAVSTIRF
jgi:Fe-S cluster assembly iron-binding protein IscA